MDDDVTIEPIDLARRAEEALAVQAHAFGLTDEESAVRLQIVLRHAGYRGVIALGAVQRGDRLVGFGYGMPNDRSHWWSTVIEPHLEAVGQGHWLDDSFAVTELHVLPAFQRRGLGSALIKGLCGRSGLPRSILSAIDAETAARRLYHALGYTDLVRPVMFPNTDRPYTVMGALLPLR
jgi:ribosomal protein S18 acetylase RimI-like enzyme